MRWIARTIMPLVLSASAPADGGQSPDQPSRGDWDFSPKKVWEIDRVGEHPLAKPAELRVSPGGSFYFHDFDHHVSYACDAKGELIRTFAGQGRGKGEISRYMNCLAGEDRVIILAPDKLHFYSITGEYIHSVPNDMFQRFPLLYLGGEGFLFAPGALTDVRGSTARIVRTDASEGESVEFARLSVSRSERKGPPGAVIIGLTPQIFAAYDPGGDTFYYGKNSEYKIRAANSKGKTQSTFGIKRARVPVTVDDKRAHFAGRKMPADRVEGLVDMLPDEAAHYHRIQVNDGLVYVFPVIGFGKPLTRQPIDIFSRTGEYLYRGSIVIEEGKHICGSPDNLRIRGDQLYAILEDESGRKTIARYDITLPSAQARRTPQHAPGGFVRFFDIDTEKTEHRIDVGGRKLSCRVYGAGGPAVVLVSGFAAPQEIWHPIVPQLAERTTVVTYDRAGYGTSDVGDRGVDGRQTAKDLHVVLEKLEIPKPVITVGHSYGGKIVRLHASEYPDDIAGIILEDAGHEDMKQVTESLLEGTELEQFRRMVSETPAEPGVRGAELRALEKTHEQLRRAGALPRVPLTVLTAGNRPPFPMFCDETAKRLRAAGLEYEKKLAKLIPGGEHVLVEGADHNIHWDKPEVVIDEILAMVMRIRGDT